MMPMQAIKDFNDEDIVYIHYHLDCSLFKLWQFEAHTQTMKQLTMTFLLMMLPSLPTLIDQNLILPKLSGSFGLMLA